MLDSFRIIIRRYFNSTIRRFGGFLPFWRQSWQRRQSCIRSIYVPILSNLHPVGVLARCYSQERQNVFICRNCGKEYTKWQGQCYACHTWNTIEEREKNLSVKGSNPRVKRIQPLKLNDIVPNAHSRIHLQGNEINRVFGGGVVPGSLVLIGGEPGIGKSTLLLRMASDICQNSTGGVLYVSGEESEDQVKLRCDRLGVKDANLYLVHETNLDSVIQLVEQNMATQNPFTAVVIDSIQTVETQECPSPPGSVAQVRFCTSRLQDLAKSLNTTVLITGHVTKSGDIAGPRTLEHMVDTVLYMEGDPITHTRILRSMKNRFGASNESGVFDMTDKGLSEVADGVIPHSIEVGSVLLLSHKYSTEYKGWNHYSSII